MSYQEIMDFLKGNETLSPSFKTRIYELAALAVYKAHAAGREEALSQVRSRRKPVDPRPGVEVKTVREARPIIDALILDLNDMLGSPQTIFVRCWDCQRVHSQGCLCPTEGCPNSGDDDLYGY